MITYLDNKYLHLQQECVDIYINLPIPEQQNH
jgi:hypothetical protein